MLRWAIPDWPRPPADSTALRTPPTARRQLIPGAAAPDFPFDPDLLRHVSPIEWKNVILYGLFAGGGEILR